jgi:hypothetical protein
MKTAARYPLVVGLLSAAIALLYGVGPGSDSPRSPIVLPAPVRAIGAITPRISPRGDAIAFSYQGAIWRMPIAGGEMRRLTSAAGFDVEPAWSADGKRIAYFNSSSDQLQLIDAETGAPSKLPREARGSGKLFFSSDGKRLLGNLVADKAEALAWLDLESGALKPVFVPPRRLPYFCLAPDGAQIAYATSQDLEGEQGGMNGPQMDVWMVPAAGGEPRKLVQFGSRIWDLWWSADELTVSSNMGGAHNDLWTIPLKEPELARKLTSGQADEDAPSISADGRWSVHTDNRENATAIVVRDLATGEDKTLSIARMDFGKTARALRLKIFEGATGKPIVARISIQEEGGKYHAPVGALYRMLGDLVHFYAAREAALSVPAGKYHIRAFRGIEYKPFHLEVPLHLEGIDPSWVEIRLERWTDPPSLGWYSGESHIHANYGYGHWYNAPETLRLQVEGEGLNVANFMVANSDTDGVFDREFFRGRPDPRSGPENILYWNEEFRATLWGHMTLLDLKQLVEPIFTGFKDTTNPWDIPTNADIADQTHLQGGHVDYTHPASNANDPYLGAYSAKALPVDVALGKIDSLDINWSYEPTLSLWYRLLNCGFKLPASAGTDCFLNRIRSRLPGADRAYVKLDGPFSYRDWFLGLRAGRSFVTNGPMLKFTAGGCLLGETIRLPSADSVPVRANARYHSPLDRVELVFNGKVVASGVLSSDLLSGTIDQAARLDKSGWLSFRAFTAGNLQAHTSPIYVVVAGKPTGAKKDAQFFLEWIERLKRQLDARARVPSTDLKARIEAQLEAARAVYRNVLAQGE